MQKPKQRKKKTQQPQYKNLNPFKQEEKRYKLYQHRETDFSKLFKESEYKSNIIDGYEVYALQWPKGVYLVKQFNNPQIVMKIGLLALNSYCKKPYRTNLDGMKGLYQEQQQQEQKEGDKKAQNTQQQKVQQKINEQQEKKGYFFNDKIRWANIGYNYDWSSRKYPQTKTTMHTSIQQLSARANKLYNSIRKQTKQYNPQSAIINYYGQKDYMTGHLDDAEIDQQSPIYSFSFGLSCIFLIGGPKKDERPVAIRLNSGDLLIMSQQSRQSYHGVPRVIKGTYQFILTEQMQKQAQNLKEKQEKAQWQNGTKQIGNYLQNHRININIRQVYPRQ